MSKLLDRLAAAKKEEGTNIQEALIPFLPLEDGVEYVCYIHGTQKIWDKDAAEEKEVLKVETEEGIFLLGSHVPMRAWERGQIEQDKIYKITSLGMKKSDSSNRSYKDFQILSTEA